MLIAPIYYQIAMINFSTVSKNLTHASQSSLSVISEHMLVSQEQSNTELLGIDQNSTNDLVEELISSSNNGAAQTHYECADVHETYCTLDDPLYTNHETNHIL